MTAPGPSAPDHALLDSGLSLASYRYHAAVTGRAVLDLVTELQGSDVAEGVLFGGCVEVLEWAMGTEIWPDDSLFDDAILFLETSEEGASPDMLANWLRKYGDLGILQRVSGLLYGRPGGGVPRGTIVGSTDEVGKRAVEVVHPMRDLHVTLLRLMGLDDNKLTYFHGGRFKQLSQVGGQVIKELIA